MKQRVIGACVIVLLLCLSLATFVSATSLTCASGESPKHVTLSFCAEWSKASCCSTADDAAIQIQVNALVNSATYPVCFDALRKAYCGSRCDQWSSHFQSVADTEPLGKVCSTACVFLRDTACSSAVLTTNVFTVCPSASASNCYGNGKLPLSSTTAVSIARYSEREELSQTEDHKVQDPLDPAAGWEGFVIVIVAGVLLIVNIVLAFLCMPCCGKCEKPMPKGADSDNVRIEPAGVPYTLEDSIVTMAVADNPTLSHTSLESDPKVQRGAILRRPARVYSDILFSFFIISDVLLLAVELAPYYLVHVSIRDFTGRPFSFQRDLLYACILMTFTCALGWYAFLALYYPKPRSPLWPLRVYIVFASLTIPIFAFFTYRGFDESLGVYYDLTRTSDTPYVSGGVSSMYTWTICLAFSIGQLIGLSHATRLVGWAEVDPSLRKQPGLPISFDASEKHRFLLHLDATEMNTRSVGDDAEA